MAWQIIAFGFLAIWIVSAEWRAYQSDKDLIVLMDRLNVLERQERASMTWDHSINARLKTLERCQGHNGAAVRLHTNSEGD